MHLHRSRYEDDNEYKPNWADREAWNEWVKAWKDPSYQAQRERGKKNRRRGNESGVAEVTHTGGSVSARRTLRILVYSFFLNLNFFSNY